jgi:LuxR family maltose regulon positive regulatory protein
VDRTNEALTHYEWTMLACYQLNLAGRSNVDCLNAIVSFFQNEHQAAADAGRHWHEVQHAVILSLAYDVLGQRTSARECLEMALTRAEPMGLVRTCISHGLPIAGLLRSLAARQRRTPYIDKLLAAMDPATSRRPVMGPAYPTRSGTLLVEPLRPREVEVLRHVADGRSNKEIANEMIMAVSTVKWYLRNIYGKLSVNRRTQALAKARELNLF